MRVQLVIDSMGPNPAFKPPDPRTDQVGFDTYDVPHTIVIPAGTVLPNDPQAWRHCLPDAVGVIRAVPVDDDARRMVAFHKSKLTGKPAAIMERFDREQAERQQALAKPIVEVKQESHE